jgi:copper chaperone NosL
VKAWLIGMIVVAGLGAGAWLVVRGSGALPDQPVPVAWDRETCGHCHMHVGEPRHAAQLVTAAGEVVNFDDVGCALDYLEARRPAVHRLWFHGEGERWLAADEVGFVAAEATPMGSGLLAVEAATPGARSLAQVEASR